MKRLLAVLLSLAQAAPAFAQYTNPVVEHAPLQLPGATGAAVNGLGTDSMGMPGLVDALSLTSSRGLHLSVGTISGLAPQSSLEIRPGSQAAGVVTARPLFSDPSGAARTSNEGTAVAQSLVSSKGSGGVRWTGSPAQPSLVQQTAQALKHSLLPLEPASGTKGGAAASSSSEETRAPQKRWNGVFDGRKEREGQLPVDVRDAVAPAALTALRPVRGLDSPLAAVAATPRRAERLSPTALSSGLNINELGPRRSAVPPSRPKDDLSWPQFFKGLGAAAAGAVVSAVGHAPLALLYAPQAYWYGSRMIWTDKQTGPLTKTGETFLLALGVPLIVALTPVAGLIHGLVRGFEASRREGLRGGVAQVAKDVKWTAQRLAELKKQAKEELARRRGETPGDGKAKDITLKQLVAGVGGALASLVPLPLPVVGIVLFQSPRVLYYGLRSLWADKGTGFKMKLAVTVLFPVGYALVNVLALPGAALYALVAGFARGMDKGAATAFRRAWEDVKLLNNKINEGIRSAKAGLKKTPASLPPAAPLAPAVRPPSAPAFVPGRLLLDLSVREMSGRGTLEEGVQTFAAALGYPIADGGLMNMEEYGVLAVTIEVPAGREQAIADDLRSAYPMQILSAQRVAVQPEAPRPASEEDVTPDFLAAARTQGLALPLTGLADPRLKDLDALTRDNWIRRDMPEAGMEMVRYEVAAMTIQYYARRRSYGEALATISRSSGGEKRQYIVRHPDGSVTRTVSDKKSGSPKPGLPLSGLVSGRLEGFLKDKLGITTVEEFVTMVRLSGAEAVAAPFNWDATVIEQEARRLEMYVAPELLAGLGRSK